MAERKFITGKDVMLIQPLSLLFDRARAAQNPKIVGNVASAYFAIPIGVIISEVITPIITHEKKHKIKNFIVLVLFWAGPSSSVGLELPGLVLVGEGLMEVGDPHLLQKFAFSGVLLPHCVQYIPPSFICF